MKTFPNECKLCGKPKVSGKLCAKCLGDVHGKTATICECGGAKIGGEYCSLCWPVKCKPVSFYCITAGKTELAGVVERKESNNFVCHGEPLAIGQGFLVQIMVEKSAYSANKNTTPQHITI